MKKIAAVAVLVVAVMWVVSSFSPVAVADSPAVIASGVVTSTIAADEEAEFIGSKKCRMCHRDVHKSWEETPHAKALDLLKPGEATEAKTKANLDPQKDYTQDKTCLECHVVGLDKKGGYEIPADEKAAKKMADLAAVGCESCHGAGGAYADFHKEIMKDKKQYTEQEMLDKGMKKPDAETCKSCHNEKSPTHPEGELDMDKMMKEGVHAHEKLELKKD